MDIGSSSEASWAGATGVDDSLEAAPAVTMLCYVSRPIPGLDQCRLRSLVKRAGEANAACGVTACLVFDGRQILQVLEGERLLVEDLFARIQRDPRHEHVRLLWQGRVQRREFAERPMTCYNLAWRCMPGAAESQQAFEGLLAAPVVEGTDIDSLLRHFAFLRLPAWPEPLPA